MNNPRTRLLKLFVGLWFAGLLGFVFYIQIVRHEYYKEEVQQQIRKRISVPAPRAEILSRRGEVLALTVLKDAAYVDPTQVDFPEQTAREIARTLGETLQWQLDLQKRIQLKNSRYQYVKRILEPEMKKKLEALRMKGLYFRKKSVRTYPNSRSACHVLGMTDPGGSIMEGAELGFDGFLDSKPGEALVYRDGKGRELTDRGMKVTRPAKVGHAVRLSLDMQLQRAVEETLSKESSRFSGASFSVVIMDTRSGQIHCMVNLPDFDPNRFGEFEAKQRRNKALTEDLLPGTLLNPLLLAAVVEDLERIGYAYDLELFAKHWQHRSWQTFLLESTPVTIDELLNFYPLFGFGRKTGVELPREAQGLLPLATNPFSPRVSMLQLMTALGSLFNDGKMSQPHLLLETVSKDGSQGKSTSPRAEKRLFSASVVAKVRRILAPSEGLPEDVVFEIADDSLVEFKQHFTLHFSVVARGRETFSQMIVIRSHQHDLVGARELNRSIARFVRSSAAAFDGEGKDQKIPNFSGLTLENALLRCREAGLKATVKGDQSGIVIRQHPKAGSAAIEARVELNVKAKGSL